jgi:hypothetical protein
MSVVHWLLSIPKGWREQAFSFDHGTVVALRMKYITSSSTSYNTYQTTGGDSVMIPTQSTTCTTRQEFRLRWPGGEREVWVEGEYLPLSDGEQATLVWLGSHLVGYVNRSRETFQEIKPSLKTAAGRPSLIKNFLFWWLVPGTIAGVGLNVIRGMGLSPQATRNATGALMGSVFLIFFSMITVGYLVKYILYSRRYAEVAGRVDRELRKVVANIGRKAAN